MPNAAPIHKVTMRRPSSPGGRLSSFKRGYGGRGWDITRRRIFKRDNYICQNCDTITIPNSRDKARRPHCDHIITKKKGGSNEDSNLQTLCGSCHSIKTIKERYL